jgi:PAS domain S-box-containing protein
MGEIALFSGKYHNEAIAFDRSCYFVSPYDWYTPCCYPTPMSQSQAERSLLFPKEKRGVRFWAPPVLSCLTLIVLIYLIWGLLDERYSRSLGFRELYYLYIVRGVSSCLLLAAWASWFVLRERRKWEGELHRSWRRYQAILLHAADAVILFDRDLRVWEWNPQAENLYGYDRAEVIGKPLPSLVGEQEQEMLSAVDRLRTETALAIETKRRNRAGEWIDVGIRLSSFPDMESGQTVFLEISSDLREQIRLRQRALEVERLTSIGRLSAGTAHVLNTPLAAMLLRIEMLKKHLREHPRVEDLKPLESSTRFCQEFVQKLLQYSRPTETSMSCVGVTELLDSICTFFRPTFQVRGHSLHLESESLAGLYIFADRYRLEALFAGLLMNSLDALSEKGTVGVHGVIRDGNVILAVRDDGCGVPPEKLRNIFEPFFTTKEPGQGTGLGLSIARNIAEDHHGSIELVNNEDRGATVRVRLPLCTGREENRRCVNGLCPLTASREAVYGA